VVGSTGSPNGSKTATGTVTPEAVGRVPVLSVLTTTSHANPDTTNLPGCLHRHDHTARQGQSVFPDTGDRPRAGRDRIRVIRCVTIPVNPYFTVVVTHQSWSPFRRSDQSHPGCRPRRCYRCVGFDMTIRLVILRSDPPVW